MVIPTNSTWCRMSHHPKLITDSPANDWESGTARVGSILWVKKRMEDFQLPKHSWRMVTQHLFGLTFTRSCSCFISAGAKQEKVSWLSNSSAILWFLWDLSCRWNPWVAHEVVISGLPGSRQAKRLEPNSLYDTLWPLKVGAVLFLWAFFVCLELLWSGGSGRLLALGNWTYANTKPPLCIATLKHLSAFGWILASLLQQAGGEGGLWSSRWFMQQWSRLSKYKCASYLAKISSKLSPVRNRI